jgi:hypothetical protein
VCVRACVRIKSDDAFGLLRERVSSQNSQQNFFQFVLSLQSPHEKCVASLNESSPRHRRTMKNAKSSLLREEEEEKGAGRGTKKKKNLSGIGSVSRATERKDNFLSFARFDLLSLKAESAKKKRKCEPVVVRRRRRCCRRRQRRYRRGAIPSPQIIVEKEERRAR